VPVRAQVTSPFLIDWLIRVDGDPIGAVVVRFDNLSPTMQSRLQLQGNARWLDGQRCRSRSGSTSPFAGSSPGTVKSSAGRRVLREWPWTVSWVWDPEIPCARDSGRDSVIRVRVEQRVGVVPISQSTLIFRFQQW